VPRPRAAANKRREALRVYSYQSSGGVNSVAFEASNTTIAAGDNNGDIYLRLYKLIGTEKIRGAIGVLSAAHSPQGDFLGVADKNGHIYIRSVGL